jgi:hypothetical protein
MRVRQIALVAEELEPTKARFFKLLGLSDDFADTGVAEFGLENSVMAIGDTFLEIVAPTGPGTTAGRLLERRGGDGGYMVILQVDELASYYQHTEALHVRKVWEVDLPDAKAFHMHPRDVGGAIVSLDQMTPPESWRWAGPNWETRKAANVGHIDGVTVQADDPTAMAERWSEILKVPMSGDQLQLKDSVIIFEPVTDERGDGVSAISFTGCDLKALQAASEELHLEWYDARVDLGGVQLQFSS